MKKAFSMIELIFVIIVIGILAGVAIPKMFATRDDAQITKIRSDISTIRSSIINLRNQTLLAGSGSYPDFLDDAHVNNDNELFDGNNSIGILLDYPIISKNSDGHWMKTSDNNYSVKLMGVDVVFEYTPNNRGKFDCRNSNTGNTAAQEMCNKLVN